MKAGPEKNQCSGPENPEQGRLCAPHRFGKFRLPPAHIVYACLDCGLTEYQVKAREGS